MKKLIKFISVVILAAMVLPGCGGSVLVDKRFLLGYGFSTSFSILGEKIKYITAWEDESTIEVALENTDSIMLEVNDDRALRRAVFVSTEHANIDADCTSSDGEYHCSGKYTFTVKFSEQPQQITLNNAGAEGYYTIDFEGTGISTELQIVPGINTMVFEEKFERTIYSNDKQQALRVQWYNDAFPLLVWFDGTDPMYYLSLWPDKCYDNTRFLVVPSEDNKSFKLYTVECPTMPALPVPTQPEPTSPPNGNLITT